MEYQVIKWNRPEPPRAEELIDEMRAEGYSVFRWSDVPGAVYADHEHDEDQSHWIISGTLELTIKEFGTVRLDPGDRDFMRAGTVHSARVIGKEPVIYLIGAKI